MGLRFRNAVARRRRGDVFPLPVFLRECWFGLSCRSPEVSVHLARVFADAMSAKAGGLSILASTRHVFVA